MNKITNSLVFKVSKWAVLVFIGFAVIFTTLTISGNNNFAKLTLADDGSERLDQHIVDITGVDDKEALKERIDIIVDKQMIAEQKSELEKQEKNLNAREASLE